MVRHVPVWMSSRSARQPGDGLTSSSEVDMSLALDTYRDRKWIAGVCAWLSDRVGISPNVVRAVFVVSCLLPGPQVLLYLGLWIALKMSGK